jgi:hypothetical protein
MRVELPTELLRSEAVVLQDCLQNYSAQTQGIDPPAASKMLISEVTDVHFG